MNVSLDTHAAAAMLMGALFSDAVSRDLMPERYPYGMEDAAANYVAIFLRGIGRDGAGEIANRSALEGDVRDGDHGRKR